MTPPTNNATIALATDLPVSVGDLVTFDVEMDKHVHNPRVEVLAYQDGQLVYGEAGDPEHEFQLGGNPDGGSDWVRNGGGPADCIVNLYYFKNGNPVTTVYLASTAFHAD